MKFMSIKKETVMLDPKNNFTERKIISEVRTDPLTGRTARICHFMKLEWEKPDFKALIADSESWCPFCPKNVLKITPCFNKTLIKEGRLRKKDMVIFPNIAPYDSIGAVETFGSHYIPLTGFTPDLIAEAFDFAIEFFKRVKKSGLSESIYDIVNWNYMPPAGSSIIHPHLQIFSSSSAPNLLRQELQGSKTYLKNKGTNFWEDLIQTEKESGDRYLGKIGRTHWMMTFAPMGVAGDVLAIVDDVCHTMELKWQDLLDLGKGIARIIDGYDKMGIYSFNMNFFTGAVNDKHFRFHLVFSPRAFFNQKLGTTDVGAMRNLFNESLCMAYPEEIKTLLESSFLS